MSKIPKLRFKEFSGEWESKKLGDIIEYKKGYAFKSNNYKNEGVRIIKISDTSATSIKDCDITCISEEEAHNYKDWELKTNDIIVSTVGSRPPLYSSMVGKIILIPKHCENTLLNQNLVRIRTNKLSTQRYLYTYLDSKRYVNYIEGICRGNANQVSITLEDLFEYKVRLPKNSEQEKIASFFSLIDNKISLQSEKVEALKDYKKGMMQKIFSRELRFKDDEGRDYPEWEEKKLGDIGFFKTSSVDKLINENEELVYLVNYMDVYKHIDISKATVTNLMQVSAKDAQIENNNLIKGDILFTPSSETPDDIGHSIVIFEDLPNTLYSYHLVRFRPYIKLNLLYSHYFCNIDSVRSQIVKFATGSTRFTVSINEFSQVKVNLPSYDEQKKIGVFLNNIDLKLRKEKEKLDSLNEYKKGLLQQMFV